jgi:hypothetical protein
LSTLSLSSGRPKVGPGAAWRFARSSSEPPRGER